MPLVRVGDGFAGGSVGQQTGLGVWTGASGDRYVHHDHGYSYHVTDVIRSHGWHKFGIGVSADGSATFFIDDVLVDNLGPQFDAPTSVSVEGYYEGTTTSFVDDLRIRKLAIEQPGISSVGGTETGHWPLP